jgi:hypothetical protein
VYLCGDFWSVNGQQGAGGTVSPNIAAVDATTGTVDTSFRLTVDGAVNDCSVSESSGLGIIVATGHFEYASNCRPSGGVQCHAYNDPAHLLRKHVVAGDATSGSILGWNPSLNSKVGGYATAQLGTSKVAVAGDFTTVNGNTASPQPGFAQFSASP